jgi:sortase A
VRSALLQTLEILLMMVAVASFTAFGLMKFEEIRGQADLKAEFERRLEMVREPKKAVREEMPAELPGEPAEAAPAWKSDDPAGAALGRLRSERIGLDVMIAEGVDDATLGRAAGRIPGTARLDGKGNVGLAAHRDTFFRPLREIQKGDDLELETLDGSYHYRVDWMAVVEPGNVDSLAATSAPALTLVTCFPFHYAGPAPRRFIVRATRVDEPTEIASAR